MNAVTHFFFPFTIKKNRRRKREAQEMHEGLPPLPVLKKPKEATLMVKQRSTLTSVPGTVGTRSVLVRRAILPTSTSEQDLTQVSKKVKHRPTSSASIQEGVKIFKLRNLSGPAKVRQ